MFQIHNHWIHVKVIVPVLNIIGPGSFIACARSKDTDIVSKVIGLGPVIYNTANAPEVLFSAYIFSAVTSVPKRHVMET
jgi:hypothetical protein